MPKILTGLWFALLLAVLLNAPSIHAGSAPDLIAAIKAGDDAQAESLLKSPAAANVRDDHGNTALHWAALRGDARVVVSLLQAGAEVDATNHAGATPLHYGTGSERIVIMEREASG